MGHLDAQRNDHRVAVIGLGYVGLTLAVSLARAGARVVGVETNPHVRAALTAKRPPLYEPGVEELLRTLPEDRFTVADRLPDRALDAVVICVGTAADPQTGRPDLRHLEAAVEHTAAHITDDTLVVVRSTVPVGTCRQHVHPRLRARVDQPLLAFCPERTIQGRALAELSALPQVIGGVDEPSAVRARELFGLIAADRVTVSGLEAAEMVKLVCNAHTDLIYGFGNEIALMADALGVDGNEVIAAANVRYPRPAVSRPGTVGGSCLTKDPYLLIHAAQEAGYHPPMVRAAREVNERVPLFAADHVRKALAGKGVAPQDAKVFVCGMAYKGRPETDDVRGAAAAEVARVLRHRVGVLMGHDFVVGDADIARLGFEPASICEGLDGADALVLLVDHPRYAQQIDLGTVRARMSPPAVVFDVWGELAAALDGAADVAYKRFGSG